MDEDDIDYAPSRFPHNAEKADNKERKRRIRDDRHKTISSKRSQAQADQMMEDGAGQESMDTDADCTIPLVDDLELLKARISELEAELSLKCSLMEKISSDLISRNEEVYRFKELETKTKTQTTAFGYDKILHDDDLVRFYTGLPTHGVFC